jgi:uncharacterized cofD-like protein
MKKIVILGGGNGSAVTINSVKKHADNFDISAVISMSDSGGSSGRLRKEFDTVPPGDIMRAVLAMSKYEYALLRKIFNKNRFDDTAGKLRKHNLGNLFLVLGEQYSGDYMSAIRALEQAVDAVGHVYPVTLEKTDLVVELDSGDVIKTEEKIDRPDYDRSKKIKKAWLEPAGTIFPEAKKVIEEADYILLSPGSLFTSVIASILAGGVKEAIEKSNAKLIYLVGDAYEIIGETGPEEVSGFVKHLQNYLPRKIDTVVYNNHKLTDEEAKKYTERKWAKFEPDLENISEYNIVQGDYTKSVTVGLSPEKLGKLLIDILK